MTFEEEKEIIKSAVDKSNNFTELIENIIKESYMKGKGISCCKNCNNCILR